MRNYELTILVKADTDDAGRDAVVSKIEKLVKALSGKVGKFTEMGRKQMAYQINHQSEALYLSWNLELPAKSVVELDRKLTVDKEIVRHLLVTVEK